MTAVRATAGAAVLAMTFAVAAGCSSKPQPGQPAAGANAPATAARPHPFRGTIAKVDSVAGNVTVAGEDVDGWMPAMTMVYEVAPPEMLAKVAVGDRITATVYDGDFKTLHDLKVGAAK